MTRYPVTSFKRGEQMKKLFSRRNFLKSGLATTAAAAVLKNKDSHAAGKFDGYPDSMGEHWSYWAVP